MNLYYINIVKQIGVNPPPPPKKKKKKKKMLTKKFRSLEALKITQ